MVKVEIMYSNGEEEKVECSFVKPKEGFFMLAWTKDKNGEPLNVIKFKWIPIHQLNCVTSESTPGEDSEFRKIDYYTKY